MDQLLEWVRNLAACMILIAAVMRILPRNHFEKYIRFYTGLLVLLLVIRPLLRLASLDDTLFQSFQYYMEQMGDDTLEEQMQQAEEQREAGISGEMEGQAAKQITGQIRSDVEREGMEVSDCQVTFDLDPESDTYGQIQSVAIVLKYEEAEGTLDAPVVIVGNQIEVRVGGADEEGSQKTEKTESEELKIRQKAVADEVQKQVADMISIDPKQVSVSYDANAAQAAK